MPRSVARPCMFEAPKVIFGSTAQPVAVSLWVAHAHAVGASEVSPYLTITSPEKRSGKSRLLEVLRLIVPRPWSVISPSEAVLFRKIDAERPTLLLDEVDTIFRDKSATYEGLRALLNAGHRRGVMVSRCVGEGKNITTRDFDIFCPKAIAGIGSLPDTVADRSIPIRLVRRAPGELVARFRHREVALDALPIREGWARWASAAIPALRSSHTATKSRRGSRGHRLRTRFLAICPPTPANDVTK